MLTSPSIWVLRAVTDNAKKHKLVKIEIADFHATTWTAKLKSFKTSQGAHSLNQGLIWHQALVLRHWGKCEFHIPLSRKPALSIIIFPLTIFSKFNFHNKDKPYFQNWTPSPLPQLLQGSGICGKLSPHQPSWKITQILRLRKKKGTNSPSSVNKWDCLSSKHWCDCKTRNPQNHNLRANLKRETSEGQWLAFKVPYNIPYFFCWNRLTNLFCSIQLLWAKAISLDPWSCHLMGYAQGASWERRKYKEGRFSVFHDVRIKRLSNVRDCSRCLRTTHATNECRVHSKGYKYSEQGLDLISCHYDD